jgi:F-type H+-transporting ATPase subunit a
MRLGPIEFITPPLVQGPKILFYVPCPNNFPFAMDLGSGNFGLPVTITVATTWVIMVVFAILFKLGVRNLQMVPGKKQAFMESLYGAYDFLVSQILGKWKKKYFVYIATLISFIFVANIISFFPIPGFSMQNGVLVIEPLLRSPTADINTTLGLALITTFTFLAAGIQSQGFFGYFKGLAEPTPVMLPLNLIGEFAKPTKISMRLFGNMFAGMVIIGLLYKAVPAVIPAPLHLYFDLFSGLVQSFVFTMLTMVYIQGSLGDAEPKLK